MTTSRVKPVTDADPIPSKTRELLAARTAASGLDETPQIYGVLARHPALFERLLGAGLGKMPDALLPIDLRELLVLRTARNCGAEYEWVHHARHAAGAGLSREDLELARDGAPAGSTSPRHSLMLAADELHHSITLSDETWAALTAHFTEPQILEALVLVGYSRIFAHVINACHLPVEALVAATFPTLWPIPENEA